VNDCAHRQLRVLLWVFLLDDSWAAGPPSTAVCPLSAAAGASTVLVVSCGNGSASTLLHAGMSPTRTLAQCPSHVWPFGMFFRRYLQRLLCRARLRWRLSNCAGYSPRRRLHCDGGSAEVSAPFRSVVPLHDGCGTPTHQAPFRSVPWYPT
jgi:hypothetical protein